LSSIESVPTTTFFCSLTITESIRYSPFSPVAIVAITMTALDIDLHVGEQSSCSPSSAVAPRQEKYNRRAEFFSEDVRAKHPPTVVDHRPRGGPLLSLLWEEPQPSGDEVAAGAAQAPHPTTPLRGQTLYLGGEVGVDGKIYCIPGHASRILLIDPDTDRVTQIGPPLESNGTKFKWLRGIVVGGVIYGLPCHASEVLRIHVPTRTVSKLPIPYEAFYGGTGDGCRGGDGNVDGDNDPPATTAATATTTTAQRQREMIWKYHGGSVCPLDGCIYAVPQSAWHVLKVDPATDTCHLVGPALPGKYKWYGGVVGESDGAIYAVPQNSPSVLRITPTSVTLHGNYGEGGHKWHGAAKAGNGDIVCIPNNVDRVLIVRPPPPPTTDGCDRRHLPEQPTLLEIGDDTVIRTGRHRADRKYKYLGAMAGTNGRVYIFPSGSEHVLEVDAVAGRVRNVGPNLRDSGMERIFQNKYQNGLTNATDQCVYGIPLSGETLLRIDCSKTANCDGTNKNDDDDDNERGGGDVEVTTWPLPSPYETLDKWEGGVICANGLMYTVPNNCKAVLKIQPFGWKPSENGSPSNQMASQAAKGAATAGDDPSPSKGKGTTNNNNERKKIASNREYGGDDCHLIYKSGIPTLRSSAHRVKFDIKSRKHDPQPRDRDGKLTHTAWLPPELQAETVFPYDTNEFDLAGAIIHLLQGCDPEIVGSFAESSSSDGSSGMRLEDFRVPVKSVWRSVNGGGCEDAQRYLSDQVASNAAFLDLFDRFVSTVALPSVKSRLVDCGAVEKGSPLTFYYQRPPTLRLQPGPGMRRCAPGIFARTLAIILSLALPSVTPPSHIRPLIVFSAPRRLGQGQTPQRFGIRSSEWRIEHLDPPHRPGADGRRSLDRIALHSGGLPPHPRQGG
jgi:hypothetical protein